MVHSMDFQLTDRPGSLGLQVSSAWLYTRLGHGARASSRVFLLVAWGHGSMRVLASFQPPAMLGRGACD